MRSLIFKSFISIVMMMPVFNTSYAEIIHHEDAIESDKITVVGSPQNGYVLARKCSKCPELRLQLSLNTRAYNNGKQVPMSNVPNQAKTAITVIFDPKTNVVNKIIW